MENRYKNVLDDMQKDMMEQSTMLMGKKFEK